MHGKYIDGLAQMLKLISKFQFRPFLADMKVILHEQTCLG